jgi:hypothetical protein
MTDMAALARALTELEIKQDDVLARLEELDHQVEQALSEWLSPRAKNDTPARAA